MSAVVKRKRGRPRGQQEVVPEQAKIYGINAPVLSPEQDKFLSPNDIGLILNVTGEAVKQWIYRRKLPAVKLANGYWKVKKSDFEDFLKARTEVGKRHILIAGMKSDEVGKITQVLEELGLQPVLSHNYPDAMLKALDHFPALFIIGVSANDNGSWAFAQNVRGNKSLRSFPILFIAKSEISEADTAKAVEIGAQGILTQPVDSILLKSEISRILQRTM